MLLDPANIKAAQRIRNCEASLSLYAINFINMEGILLMFSATVKKKAHQLNEVSSQLEKQTVFQKLARDYKLNKAVYFMALPVLVYYVIFHYIPMGGLVIAFQKYNLFKGISGSDWIGLDNFIKFFTGRNAWRLVKNTFMLSFYSIIFSFPTPIIFALLVNEVKSVYFKKVAQTISYMPHFISLVVICGMIKDFSSTNGLFNDIVIFFGGAERTNLLTNVDLFRTIFIGTGVWQGMGWSSIIYLATLSNVDPSLYDAAYIDGAGRIKRIIYVTFPALIPVISVQLIMRMGNILSVGFEKVILLYNPLTYAKADVISSFVYRYGLQEANYSYGTAVGIFNSIINIAVLVLVNQTFKKFSSNSLW